MDGYQKAIKRIEEAKKNNSTELDLSDLKLTEIPESITDLKNLNKLDFHNNLIKDIPEYIIKLKTLKELYVYENRLTEIPEYVVELKKIRKLSFGNNKLCVIPEAISKLNNLKELYLYNNKLTDISKYITKLKNLNKLNIANNLLKEIPDSITDLKNLKELYLSGNQLTDIPQALAELKSLNWLDMSYNQLTYIPQAIVELKSLNWLSLSYNQLSDIPETIAELKNLKELYLAYNQLTDIPNSIAELKNLNLLDLSNNQITDISEAITELKNLNRFYLSNNKISVIPVTIFKLKNLEELSLSNNQLREVSGAIVGLKNLSMLSLSGNPIETPPLEICYKGMSAIKTYFEEIENTETVKLFEAKMLIVGQGEVGKTYLKNRLIHDKVEEEVSTEGIDIDPWFIKTEKSDKFRINFWDFGGQEIYHATHQYFLSKRSLYLFVWIARTDTDLLSFDYWLNTIKLLSDNSPVLVVQSKIDERSKNLDKVGWKNKFDNIVDYHDVSSIENIGIKELKKAIVQEIDKLPLVGDLLPKRWLDIRENLEKLNKNYIPYSEYLDICSDYAMQVSKAENLCEYFHDLGVFLCFRDNPILKHTVFLKPEWATKAVYIITEDKEVIKNYGWFKFKDLERIWSEYPPEKHVELIELMKSFEICFELPQGREYIIPELLKANQPPFDWDTEDNLRFKYKYDFMPAGIMTRLIVNVHDLIEGDLYWKNGTILSWEGNRALIIQYNPREIEIKVKGPDKKSFLNIIRWKLDYIHSSFKNLEVKEMVPCSCVDCKTSLTPHFYEYKALIKYQDKGIKEIPCPVDASPASVKEMLFGVPTILEKEKNEILKSVFQDFGIDINSSRGSKDEK